MSTSGGNETLDCIQQEIKESLEREEELRKEYARHTNGNLHTNGTTEEVPHHQTNGNGYTNGISETPLKHPASPKSPKSAKPQDPPKKIPNGTPIAEPVRNGGTPIITNGTSTSHPASNPTPNSNPTPPSNGFRRFAPNPSAKGVMQKFLKMRGKMALVNSTGGGAGGGGGGVRPQQAPLGSGGTWAAPHSDTFEPAKVTLEAAGKPLRNGFVPAEEKMRRELLEFQKREEELRKERRKSQPDLMAALESEQEVETNLKPARSTAQLWSTEDLTDDVFTPPPSATLKPALSLADLCEASDDELETPGTHSLILQFESLKLASSRT